MTTSIFTPQPAVELALYVATMSAFNHGSVCQASQEPLPDTMTAFSSYTTTPGPVKPPVPPVPHSNPKPSPNTARDGGELKDRPALTRPEPLPSPSLPCNSLTDGHEPPPVPTTPPPESPKNRCAHLVSSFEPVGRGRALVQDDVRVDLAGEHELPPVPTTPPPPPPQGKSTRGMLYSIGRHAFGLGVDAAGADSTGKHEPPPVPHTPPPPSPKNRSTHDAANSIVPCALAYGNSTVYVDLAGKHEPPPPPITPPPSPPTNRSMHHEFHGKAQSALVFNGDIFAQFMLEVAFVSGVMMKSHKCTLSIADTVLPTVPFFFACIPSLAASCLECNCVRQSTLIVLAFYGYEAETGSKEEGTQVIYSGYHQTQSEKIEKHSPAGHDKVQRKTRRGRPRTEHKDMYSLRISEKETKE
ncbi:hypothetical protein FRC10_001524 [Ceratobasidium sp. 414]|nr:hypothetical protein FRC10_001524 [Ceratobasidium sp. 414]